MTDISEMTEYRVVQRNGLVTHGWDRVPILSLHVAEACRVWSEHIYAPLGPYRIESRPYRNDSWCALEETP